MKRSFLIGPIGFLMVSASLWSQPQAPAYDPGAAYSKARDLAFSGHRGEARETLIGLLADYPENTDVQVLLAKTYSWDGDYDQARLHLNRITSRERDLEEGWVAAIKNERYAGNPSLALGLANKALLYLVSSHEIEALRQAILEESRTASPAVPTTVEGAEEPAKNLLSLSNELEVFDKGYDPMYYTSLEYQRTTPMGKILPRLNYSNRFDTQGLQAEMDLYPVLSKTFHGYLNYGFSEAAIYPNHRAGAELYANLPGGHEASLGGRYLDFRESTATLLTASYGLYRGNYYLSLRPYLSLFRDRSPGVSGSFLLRKYFRDAYQYLSLRGVFGYSPEIRQLRSGAELLAETLLFVESQQLQLEYQFAGAGARNRYRAQLGVGRQEFLFESGSFYWVFQAGLRYQYGF